MSKASKSLARAKRKSKKSSLRDANREKYREWAAKGENKKKKSGRDNKKSATSKHTITNCGNIGCKKCSRLNLKSTINNRLLYITLTPLGRYKKRVSQLVDIELS